MTALVACTLTQGEEYVNLCIDRTNTGVVSEVAEWLNDCHERHTQCRNLGWSRKNPSNLVHLNSNGEDLRLVETSYLDLVPYAVVSYTWGDELATEDERQQIKGAATKDPNIGQRRKSFPMSELPQTIKDAMRLALSLNLQYVWVDDIFIPPNADCNEEASKMHEVYGNAYITLATCSSTKATEGIPSLREAWRYEVNPCRLFSGQWLANVSMTFDEVRTRSPLFTRAWTLQEESLSTRTLYICGQRLYWSCSVSQLGEEGHNTDHQSLSGSGNDSRLREPQSFLQARFKQNVEDLHEQWLELVRTYAKRDIFRSSDRFPAIGGLAAQYLEPFTDENGDVKKQEYLAGLWRLTIHEDIAWSVQAPKIPRFRLQSVAPTWSWASLPVSLDIVTQKVGKSTEDFLLLEEPNLSIEGQSDRCSDVVMRGSCIRSIKVCGRVRPLLSKFSAKKEWSSIVSKHGSQGEFDFSSCLSEFVYARNASTGRVVAYEPHKQEVVAQLDYLFPEKGPWDPMDLLSDRDLKKLVCLEVGQSSMLLLRKDRKKQREKDDIWKYQRVGICNSTRESFFVAAPVEIMYLV